MFRNTIVAAGVALAIGVIVSTSPAEATSCGAENERPCTIFERIPSCNAGLVEDFRLGRCVAKSRPGFDCGRENQRPCKIFERIPSCNAGLMEDFVRRMCVSGRGSAGSPVTIQTIPLDGPYGRGIAVHSKVDNGAANDQTTRICLKNSTNHPKMIQHSRQGTNPLSAATLGSQSCANFPSSMRLEFVFLDRSARVKGDAMNLSAYAGDIVTFDWRHVGAASDTVNRGQITFYEHCGYQGRSVTIPNGRHTLASLRALGMKNDDISSIQVQPGNIVAIYQHDSFGGRRIDFDRNVSCLVDHGFNDLLSSAIVWRE